MCARKSTPMPTPAGLRLEVTVVELGSTESTMPDRSTSIGLLPASEVTRRTPVPGEPVLTGANSTASLQELPIESGAVMEHVVVTGSLGLVSSVAEEVAGAA